MVVFCFALLPLHHWGASCRSSFFCILPQFCLLFFLSVSFILNWLFYIKYFELTYPIDIVSTLSCQNNTLIIHQMCVSVIHFSNQVNIVMFRSTWMKLTKTIFLIADPFTFYREGANTHRPGKHERQYADHILKCMFFNDIFLSSLFIISQRHGSSYSIDKSWQKQERL